MSSQGRTMRGAVAFTAPAKAATHCETVALSGRWPTLATKRLFSASEFLGVSSETSNPAPASADGMRAVPIQRVAVEASRTGNLRVGHNALPRRRKSRALDDDKLVDSPL